MNASHTWGSHLCLPKTLLSWQGYHCLQRVFLDTQFQSWAYSHSIIPWYQSTFTKCLKQIYPPQGPETGLSHSTFTQLRFCVLSPVQQEISLENSKGGGAECFAHTSIHPNSPHPQTPPNSRNAASWSSLGLSSGPGMIHHC